MERGRRLTPCSVANHSVRRPTGSAGKGGEMLCPPDVTFGFRTGHGTWVLAALWRPIHPRCVCWNESLNLRPYPNTRSMLE